MSAKLVILVTEADLALPVSGCTLSVNDRSGRVLYEEYLGAAQDGRSGEIDLFTPPADDSLEPEPQKPRAYSVYDVTVKKPGFFTVKVTGVQMFDGVSSTLPVEMIPLAPGEGEGSLVYDIKENALLNSDKTPDREPATDPDVPAVPTILSSVYVPFRVRVHLGRPDEAAPNVSVSFTDYIKNVASSEIYPTWPEQSLRANITAQVSLVLNRFFTEWYPSRGYDYDITNSTAFDQYFVFGRNIFDNISRLVDEIFDEYIRRPGRIEPLYAEYCNGSTVSCAGMSQWGTVSLAQEGLSAFDILSFYYGDIERATAGSERAVTPSYPGSPVSQGDRGDSVVTIQQQLDRIAVNYPSVTVVEVDGIFGPSTRRQVTNFQRIFSLVQDGVVGRETWNRISYVYSSVKKLAELNSEGERADYNSFEYPGTPLDFGSKGNEVQQIQFYLDRIALFNPFLPPVAVDGIYLAGTQQAVREFQSYYGLTVDGVVGKSTWDRIVGVYQSTLDGDVDPGPGDSRPYPGSPLRSGSRGEDVSYIQRRLNTVSTVFSAVPRVTADGSYGPLTLRAVTEFQRVFGLSPDGVVGRSTWDKIDSVYGAVASDCLFNSAPAQGLEPYPGYVIYVGSAGSRVRYIQRSLNTISAAIPYIPSVSADGRFGPATQNAVRRLQTLFSISADGSVGRETWTLINQLLSAISSGCLGSAARPASLTFDPSDGIPAIGAFGKEIAEFKREFTRITGVPLPEGMLFGIKSAAAVKRYLEGKG